MNVHLFGKNDSPCVANLAWKKAGADKKDIIHPSVVTSIDRDFFKDGFLNSENSEQHLTRIKKSAISILEGSGFRLKKFVSNNQDILNKLREKEILNKKAIAEQRDQESTHLRIKLSDKNFLNTKRGLLCLLCSIFDSLGIVSPCPIEPKLIIQGLCERKVHWDEELASSWRMAITRKIHVSYFYKQKLWYRHTH